MMSVPEEKRERGREKGKRGSGKTKIGKDKTQIKRRERVRERDKKGGGEKVTRFAESLASPLGEELQAGTAGHK